MSFIFIYLYLLYFWQARGQSQIQIPNPRTWVVTKILKYLTFHCFLGSFFIPLILIVFLYFKIFTTQQKVASRRKQIKTNTGGQGHGGRQVHREHKHLWSEWFISGQLYAYISHQSMFCMHYIPVLSQESENKQMRIEMVKGLCILLLLIPYLTLT